MEHVPCWSQPLRRGVGGDSLGQDQESRALESVQRTGSSDAWLQTVCSSGLVS